MNNRQTRDRDAPVVGITMYAPCEENGGQVSLPVDYVRAVQRAGGLPVLIPPGGKVNGKLFHVIDALILAGGGDIDPELYGSPSHDSVYMVDGGRDRLEIELAMWALEQKLPTLGICRGTQIINVGLGGTLHVHLPDVYGDQVPHRAPPRKPISHEITATSGSRVAKIMQTERACPMSWHHQAIDRLADPLQVVARAADGVLEAIEHPDHPWLVAVQWHPELTAENDPTQQRLFDALVEFARKNRDK